MQIAYLLGLDIFETGPDPTSGCRIAPRRRRVQNAVFLCSVDEKQSERFTRFRSKRSGSGGHVIQTHTKTQMEAQSRMTENHSLQGAWKRTRLHFIIPQ